MNAAIRSLAAIGFTVVAFLTFGIASGHPEAMSRQVLAFYYGWYGNPVTSRGWVHWKDVDPAAEHIASSTHFPVLGAYDSHDLVILDKHAALAQAAGLTGFIASWWGRGSFEDQGIAPLLSAAVRHGLAVTVYYEKLAGSDPEEGVKSAIADFDYLLARYGGNKAWLRVGGKPVIFVYGRAVNALPADKWRDVLAHVRRDNPAGAVFIADSRSPQIAAVFDGTSTYNIAGNTPRKTPAQIAAWARGTYPNWIAGTPPGKISTVTVIPGYDDRAVHPAPRPVTSRWGGEVYRALWEAAITASPDWVLITSWNEWHEGSEIEPSVEYGSSLLDLTASFARQFLSAPNSASPR